MKILRAKERRARHREELAKKFGKPIITLSINTPGPAKNFEQVRRVFQEAYNAVRSSLKNEGLKTLYELVEIDPAGPILYIVVNHDAHLLKLQCTQIESSSPVGRLIDLDVAESSNRPISRTELGLPPRKCFVCDDVAQICAAIRKHPLSDCLNAFSEISARN